jgi:hypothetical protein
MKNPTAIESTMKDQTAVFTLLLFKYLLNIRDLYRGINDVKKWYQPRTRIVKDEKGDLVADSHSIMAR